MSPRRLGVLVACVLSVSAAADLPLARSRDSHRLVEPSAGVEQWRPIVHFTPPRGFMNDPNGLVFAGGLYHLFYQHNPFGPRWGHMSWGHAVSRDLITWRHRPIALREADGWMVFSGSAVADSRDTSGLCSHARDCLAAIYTMDRKGHQAQGLAVSRDGGVRWTPYAGNPVLDLGLKDFRDPKVIWHSDTRRWVMAVAVPDAHVVRFFGSGNLRDWTPLSAFGPAGAVSGVWECPTLMRVPVDGTEGAWKWVLAVSVSDGAPAGGTGMQYFVGEFDGTSFVADGPASAPAWVDAGPDFYAAQDWSNLPAEPSRHVWVGWMSNWVYANDEPSGEGGVPHEPTERDWAQAMRRAETPGPWRGAMTIPRELGVRQVDGAWRLVQRPVRELDRTHVALPVGDTRRLHADAMDLTVTVHLGTAKAAGLFVQASDTAWTRVAVSRAAHGLEVDRRNSGTPLSTRVPGTATVPLGDLGTVRFRLLIDRSSLEIFADDGLAVLTMRSFPATGARDVLTFVEGGQADVDVSGYEVRLAAAAR